MGGLLDGCTVAEVTRVDGVTAPAIWVSSGEKVEILGEALALAFSEVDRQRPYQRVVQLIASIAQLIGYYLRSGKPLLDERGLRPLIEDYILLRSIGDPEQGWKPLSHRALETEVRNIAYFSDFCEREYGYLSLVKGRSIGLPSPKQGERAFWRLMACNETDFFSHLAVRRDKRKSEIRIPGRSQSRGASHFVGMTESFAWDLVEAERNPTFKALWLLGFFGGPRLSEMLNLWACDVLPGTFREHWFKGDIFYDLPLVVVANPWLSRWCGKVGDERLTRAEFLLKNYGLHPRPLMAETEAGSYRGKAAGFKGTRPTHQSCAMRQIFWAREEAALRFGEIIVEVLGGRNRMPRSRLHPFLFVNTDRRKPEIQGEMLTLSNARKAFERAVVRVGGVPFRNRQSPHGMRHHYKDLIRDLLGSDAGAIQVCMGHRSRESQDQYGSLDMQALRHAMSFARTREEV